MYYRKDLPHENYNQWRGGWPYEDIMTPEAKAFINGYFSEEILECGTGRWL